MVSEIGGRRERLAGIANWMNGPWTADQRARERADIDELHSRLAARGTLNSGIADRERDKIKRRHRSRRVRSRLLGAVIAVVIVSAAMTVFTANRVPKAVMVAALASAAPVALYLGLRRGDDDPPPDLGDPPPPNVY